MIQYLNYSWNMSMNIVHSHHIDVEGEETECVLVVSIDQQALSPSIRHVTTPVDHRYPPNLRPGGKPFYIASHALEFLSTVTRHLSSENR